jgi:hypothetical protein
MQGYRGELYLYAKYALRVNPYFQVLASSLWKLNFKLIS